MDEVRSFIISLGLVSLAGIALHRAVGPAADPFAGLAVFVIVRVGWSTYHKRKADIRRAIAELRTYEAADRQRILEAVESEDLRQRLRSELGRDGSETRDGLTEVFPFPEALRRRATRRYWRDWATSAAALLIAALVPALDPIWRELWLAAGIVLLWRARRFNRWYQAVASVIEVNPFRIAHVWPDGARQTISFADGAVCEDVPADQLFVVRSGSVAIPVSYHLMGFNRIAQLVEEYGAAIPTDSPPAS
jgi:hypothetical protein